MKVQIQQTPTQQLQFKGAMDSSLRYLATNQAIGANGVDFCFMVTPRTASDTIKRGPAAGLETFRREIMGMIPLLVCSVLLLVLLLQWELIKNSG